ncbi:MAG: STAS domain-containing protein [Chloroflexaceae bacterium]|nr:STAS domain-containing protein [Chloroflexaceae bacterium]
MKEEKKKDDMEQNSNPLPTETTSIRQGAMPVHERVRENTPTTFVLQFEQGCLRWDIAEGTFSFYDIPMVSLWLDPSFRFLLEPLVTEVGVPLFRLLTAFSSSIGTREDYQVMVTTLGDTFQEGFLAWGREVSLVGWGRFAFKDFDETTQRATVVITNPWELKMQQHSRISWGCPFLQGKIIGIFSHAFGTTCWADEHLVPAADGSPAVEFAIYPSQRTIEAELVTLRAQKAQEREYHLRKEIERQTRLLHELSTPLLPISDHTVLMPLIGSIDTRRVQQIMETLLEGVAQHQAELAILDVTGVSVVDTQVAQALVQAAQAVRLLGAQVMLTGIQPQIAQTLVHLGVDLSGITTCSNLQAGIAAALNRRNPRPWG